LLFFVFSKQLAYAQKNKTVVACFIDFVYIPPNTLNNC